MREERLARIARDEKPSSRRSPGRPPKKMAIQLDIRITGGELIEKTGSKPISRKRRRRKCIK